MRILVTVFFALRVLALSATDVPWEEIKQAIMKPSQNNFTDSSFIVEDFHFTLPPSTGLDNKNIPMQYFVAASLIGFQSASDRVFNFFSGGNNLLSFFPLAGQLQVKQKFENHKKQAYVELQKYSLGKTPDASDEQLLAYWLFGQSANISDAMQIFYESFYIEPRNNFPIKSTVKEAKLILKLGLPFYVLNGNNGFICLGFYEKDGKTLFIMIDPEELKEAVRFSFFNRPSHIHDIAKTLSWQSDWKIFYVPIIQRSNDRAHLLKDIKLDDEL
jgi:hypothetical protein